MTEMQESKTTIVRLRTNYFLTRKRLEQLIRRIDHENCVATDRDVRILLDMSLAYLNLKEKNP